MGVISPEIHDLKTGEAVTIRTAAPGDAAALLAHVRAVIKDGEGVVLESDEFAVTEEQEQDWIRLHTDDPGQLALVAEISGQIVGLVHLESGSRRRLAHRAILAMSVASDWRGRGIGPVLLRTLIQWAEAHPRIEKLSLAVLATNGRAVALYRNHGFIEEGRRVREIRFGANDYADDILMYRLVQATT